MKSTEDRFWSKVAKQEGGCWLWTASLTYGYGHFQVQGRRVRAHRYAYEALVGPIPEGLVLDHLCRVRHCVNPAHLEPVTNRTNVLRGVGAPAQNATLTHCRRGHEFTPANTLIDVAGGRSCKACKAWRLRRDRLTVRDTPRLCIRCSEPIIDPVDSCPNCSLEGGPCRRPHKRLQKPPNAVFCSDRCRIRANHDRETERARLARRAA